MKTVEFITSEKSVLEMDFCDKECVELKEVFDSGKKNVVLYSDDQSFATDYALGFALGENSVFSKVIYARFDRADYLYTKSMKKHSIDTILKNSLCRVFVLEDCADKSCRAENYLLKFESVLDKNTLLIIDGFDISSPSPYMRHLFTLECSVIVITEKIMNSLSDEVNFLRVGHIEETVFNPECLEDKQKELLMTLCAMLRFLDDTIPIVSSKNGVFDRDSVRFYLGTLSGELDSLIAMGLVKISESGRIHIEKSLEKQVLCRLSPDSENCKTFMQFASKVCDFRILQNVKDISAQLYTLEDDYNSFSSSIEFMSVYSHFCKSDKNAHVRVYNMLVGHMIENLSMQKGADYSGHLLFKNMPYYISLLCEMLEDENNLDIIYDDELYMEEYLPEIYTKNIKAKLDVIRLCLSYIRNMTIDMYKIYESVFEKLYESMTYIFGYVRECNFENEMKMALLDDVIRLCSESFDYFCVVDKDGIYNPRHDSFEKRRIFYHCERESDTLYGDSIPFGFSILTLRLYETYADFLSKWLYLSQQTEQEHFNSLLRQLHEEKLCDRKNTLEEINAHFVRCALGYENFTDIYLQGAYGTISEKRIEDNKRYLSRGFDGATLRGAERYTKGVINALKMSKVPLRIALTVLSPNYPLSDESFRLLIRENFAKHLCENKNMPNLSLQILLETLVCDYTEAVKRDGQKELYEYMFLHISDVLTTTETFLERMYHAVSSMYVSVRKNELLQNGKLSTNDFCEKLYEKFCADTKQKEKFCDDYIAKAIYSKLSGKVTEINRTLIENAIKTHKYENRNSSEEGEKLLEYILK